MIIIKAGEYMVELILIILISPLVAIYKLIFK